MGPTSAPLQPDVFVGGVRIQEPVIALTGLGVGVVCTIAWLRLRKRDPKSVGYRSMMRFFAFMAASSVVGPVFGHAFKDWAGFPGKYAGWLLGILASNALGDAVIVHAKPLLSRSVARGLLLANWLTLFVSAAMAGVTHKFFWAQMQSVVAMLVLLLPLESLVYRRRRDPGSRLLLASLPIAIVALVPTLVKWSPHRWFGYFDVSHVILYACFWVMMLGASQMRFDDGESVRN